MAAHRKLSADQVKAIITAWQAGAHQTDLARAYGVTQAAIAWHIARHKASHEPLDPPADPPDPLAQLLASLLPGDWIVDGLCSQIDPGVFYPEKGGSTRQAKAVCARCPVRPECLEFALDNKERYGIWGGLSERERRRLLRIHRARTGGAA